VPLSDTIICGLARPSFIVVRPRVARDRGVGNRRQTLSGHVIDDVEDAEAATAGELVVDEVEPTPGTSRRLFRKPRK
jgi:hypothetical protein